MHEAVQDSVLHVAEREGSSSVHERIDCADPVQPRFRRVEHAFGRLGRYHGVERREEERTESGPGHGRADRTSARHCDRSGRATGCGKGAIGAEGRDCTKGRDTESCPCHDGTRGEYRSDRETSRTGTREEHRSYREANRTSRKGKGIGDGKTGIRSSEGSSRARDPREAFCRDGESSGGNVRTGSEVSNESLVKLASSTRSERRGEANQKSSQAASTETAAPVGSGCRPSASSSKRTISATVMDCGEGRPRAERINQESAEAAHQSSSEGADCEVAIGRTRSSSLPGYRKGRVHGAEQASCVDRAKGAPATESVRVTCEKGVRRDPAPKGSHDGELDRFGSLGCWGHGRDPRSSSGECSDPKRGSKEPRVIRLNGPRADHIRNHRSDRRHAGGRSGSEKTGDQAWDCLLHEATTSREGEGEVHVPGQVTVEASWQRRSERDRCQYFRMDVGDSRSASPRADRGEPEAVGRFGQEAEDAFDHADQGQVSAYRPSAAARAATRMATTGQAATCSAAKEAASSESGERQAGGTGEFGGERQAGGTGESGERQSGEDVGSDRPDGDSGAENAIDSWSENTTDQTQSEKSTAYRRAKSGGRRGVSSESQRPSQGSREGYRDPQAREGAHGVRIGCEEGTEVSGAPDHDQRAHLFRTELSSEREAEAIEWEKELARREKEERKAQALYRSERRAQALEHGREIQRQRQEEFLKWKAEEEDRENLTSDEGKTNFSRADLSATSIGRSDFDASTDSGNGRESFDAARSASSAIVRGRDCVPQATAGASFQVFGQEGRREVGRDVRSVGREGRHDIQSVQVPPERGVEPPIRARAHFSNPAFDVVRKKEIVCTVESEPEFEFEYPIELRGNRLAKHILQSHTPYDPSCAVCLTSKGLKRAPKRTDQVTNEIQMDIANLCTHPKSPNMYRYVVIWNRTHGMIATVAIYVDQASTIRVLTAAINHCSSTGAMVLSDEGRDLTALISELIRLKVVSRHETSRPGRHATGAERAVRTLKTQLGCIRTVLYQHGLMLGSESLRYAAANACHVHNAFQLQANSLSSLTPYQRMRISVTSSGEVPNTNRVMPFGCLVFARPTDGYLEKVREANTRHFVPGIYLTPKLSSLGHFVAFEGSQDETVVVPVRDLKIASPIRFVAGRMLCEIPNSKSGVKPDRIERLPNDLSKPQKLVDLPIHEGEPPWYWSEVNKTSRCPACSNGSETGHSVKCRNRYKKYLEEEYKRIVTIEDESSVPVVPEGLEEGLDTEGKPESQQESGERVPESESEREKRKRKSIDDEWDRFHREHEEKETGERFPEFDDVPFHAPKGQEADTGPTGMQEDPTNPYEIGKNPEPIEDDRMSEGYEPTEVPEGYKAPESPGESPMEVDLFQKIPRRGKNRNHDHWEVDLDKLVLRRVHHRSRKCVFAASSLPLPMPEDQLVGIQRTYYVDAVDERPVDEIPRDQFKVHQRVRNPDRAIEASLERVYRIANQAALHV